VHPTSDDAAGTGAAIRIAERPFGGWPVIQRGDPSRGNPSALKPQYGLFASSLAQNIRFEAPDTRIEELGRSEF
jgi:hypothetical protein